MMSPWWATAPAWVDVAEPLGRPLRSSDLGQRRSDASAQQELDAADVFPLMGACAERPRRG